ncbi:hypothetical protein HO133_002579 [Letharia lupina]|uniref:Uncharacterized protein n=1 Tax=Letharia lupina TaxID=560253 RepID=A0A8H6CCV9_9LECA|nr:uncharacterized protein HO133_002579 [Letharia lupina]KAF6220899.1 hypothetical protein HO133_002579 [Letharia lupina]
MSYKRTNNAAATEPPPSPPLDGGGHQALILAINNTKRIADLFGYLRRPSIPIKKMLGLRLSRSTKGKRHGNWGAEEHAKTSV